MSAPQFTPGPWSHSAGNLIRVSAASPERGWKAPVCVAGVHRIGTLSGREREGEAIANARLIAAAPELYEALDLFVHEYTELVNSGDAGFWDPEEEHKVIIARAALAKARGDQ